jgi:hypothetical protein
VTAYAIYDPAAGIFCLCAHHTNEAPLWVSDFYEATIFSSARNAAERLQEVFDPFHDLVVVAVDGSYEEHLDEQRRHVVRVWRTERCADALVRSLNEYGEGLRDLYERR